MNTIINKCLNGLTAASTLTEIKTTLLNECNNATFNITENDYFYMLTEILYKLAEGLTK